MCWLRRRFRAKARAELSITGTRKVSNLILNINLYVRVVAMRAPDQLRRCERYRQNPSPKGRIASSRMLLDNFPLMTGATSPNRVGVVDGGKDQHGRAARSGVGGNGALPVGQAGGEGKHPRPAVRDDRLASPACGARPPAKRDGWAGRSGSHPKGEAQI